MAEINITDLVKEDKTGVIQVLAENFKQIVHEEFRNGYISQTDYASVFIQGYQALIGQGMEFVLRKQEADKQAELIQQQTLKVAEDTNLVTGQIALTAAQTNYQDAQKLMVDQQTANLLLERDQINANVALSGSQKLGVEAETAFTTARTANVGKEGLQLDKQLLVLDEDIAIKQAQVTQMGIQNSEITARTSLIGQQEANAVLEGLQITEQTKLVTSQKAIADAEVLNIPKQGLDIEAATAVKQADVSYRNAQIGLVDQQTANALTENTTIIKQQSKLDSEVALLAVKKFVEEAQYKDIVDGASVVGTIGKKNALYDAQIAGFANDYEVKKLNVKANVFNIMRSTNEALMPDSNIYDGI